MTHPIAIGLMSIVLLLGVGLGLVIHAGRDYVGNSSTESEYSSGTSSENEGELFGFITSFESSGDRIYVAVDAARLFNGEAAVNAALSAGLCTPEDLGACAPNDFYIDNPIVESVWYTLSPDVNILMETLRHTEEGAYVSGERITLPELRQLFEDPRTATLWRQIPFWIEVEEGRITEIREQYVP